VADVSGVSDDVDGGGAPAPHATFRVMDVVSVAVTLPSQNPVVELREADPPYRGLSVPVGLPEGAALSYALERMATPRPLTHELFSQVLTKMAVDVVAVRMTGRRAGTYLAELDLMGPRGKAVLDCRPSDGFILALRQGVPAPVLADERLLASGGDVAPVGGLLPPAD